MNIKWLKDAELEIVYDFDEDNDRISGCSYEMVRAGQIDDVEIIESDDNYMDIQFPDGGMAFTVNKAYFIIIDDKD